MLSLLPAGKVHQAGASMPRAAPLKPHRQLVLNISRLLSAALTAQSAESVEAGVSAMVRWVEVNGAQKRTCFLDGALHQSMRVGRSVFDPVLAG
eukprot:scaffold194538_cov18-Tisochrysis_lutea.AAC.1